ncbi:MAG: transglutaminase-like domain-containing protein [Candidatus Omnitrophica bacterium]|nr:transglutaminase-like domain-containing protein [Candidatus Omnitrophota bacterium]MDD5671738.1 transglutaminase-like domain-containing protein [Candidatus Omnitrophota bacterium]
MNRKRFLASVLIFGLWLLSAGMLIQKEWFPFWGQKDGLGLRWDEMAVFKEYWMGLYHQGQKIGHSHVWVHPVETLEEGGLQILSDSVLRMSILGQERPIHWADVTQFDPDFRPTRFDFQLDAGPYQMRFSAKRTAGNWTVQIKSGEEVLDQKTIADPSELYPAPSLGAILSLIRWNKTKAARFTLFDPFTQSVSPVAIRITGTREEMWRGEKKKVYELETDFQGIKAQTLIAENGEVLREESPLGFSAINESMQKATELSAVQKPVDLANLYSIPSNLILDNPRGVRVLKAQMEGIDLERYFLVDDRQKILDPASGLIEIKDRFPGTSSAVPPPADLTRWLAATPFVQSRHPEILETARKIAAGETDPFKATCKILQWLRITIQPSYTMSVPSGLDVLRKKQGDCNEITILFTALARSLGIPTKMIAGIVYLDGKFYYHAWPEIYAGGWIAMDPTLGMDVADATHIGLIEGDLNQQLKLMSVLGKIKLKILKAE